MFEIIATEGVPDPEIAPRNERIVLHGLRKGQLLQGRFPYFIHPTVTEYRFDVCIGQLEPFA
ncbi:MAG: hypothetical protein IPG92_15655 [Flavobacteriales bacterium]|nr:hypothetical protein [Flavobacteriales bacterium]